LVVRGQPPPAHRLARCPRDRSLLGVTSGTSLLRSGENYKGAGGEANARALPTTRPSAVPRTARPGALEAIWDLSGSAQG
jgi:hypothetical protein